MTVYASVLKKPSQNYWDVFDLPGRLYATCSRLHFPVYLRINFMLSVCIHGSPMKGALHRFSLNSCRDENWTWWSLHKSFLCRCEAYQTDKAGKIEHILQSQTEKKWENNILRETLIYPWLLQIYFPSEGKCCIFTRAKNKSLDGLKWGLMSDKANYSMN